MKTLITTLLFLFCNYLHAESLLLLSPSNITFEENSAELIVGNYVRGKKIDEDHVVMNLESTKVIERYDEVVLFFENVPKGQYKFRFKKISKPKYSDLEYCNDKSGTEMDSFLQFVTRVTAHASVLSEKGSDTAQIRLSRELPVKSYVEYIGIVFTQGPVCLMEPPITKAEWQAASKLTSEWSHLMTVKTAKNLVLRIPKEAYDLAESFELAVVTN